AENSKERTIDITTLPNGVYFLSIEYNGKRFNKRIIKED
ncbi:MAG: T9SS type A sorting domain-containing protein, partial [Winogradskyella sp.]|nr:T9SS type A sorting domain-containing protein [Winogradskyella sp.]